MRQQARAKLESRLVDKEIELQAVRQKLEEVCVVCVRERGKEGEREGGRASCVCVGGLGREASLAGSCCSSR